MTHFIVMKFQDIEGPVMLNLERVLKVCVLLAGLCGVAEMTSAAKAQEAGDAPPQSGIVEEDTDGQRLGDVPNDQIRQFNLRRACENDLPECEPWVREILEKERRNRMWMGVGVFGVILLIFLLARREAARKQERQAREARKHKKLGARVAKKWRNEVKDPYKDADPLGDK